MSDYGVFEASSTDGHEEEQQQRQAQRDLGRAIEAAREGFGDFLAGASDKDDYTDRLALIMNDLMQKVADSGVMPVPGVMRKVKAALRPQFRRAALANGTRVTEIDKSGFDLGREGVVVAYPAQGDTNLVEVQWDDGDHDYGSSSTVELWRVAEIGSDGRVSESSRKQATASPGAGPNAEALEWAENYFQKRGGDKSDDPAQLWKDALGLAAGEFGTNFSAEDYVRHSSRKQTASSWKEVNPRSEGLHPDNAVWKIQGPNGLSGTVIDELKSGTDSDWFIFGPNGLILNRKFGEPPLTVDEAKKLVEDHINSGTLASRKQASVEDLRSYVESKGVTTSDKDNGFTFPTADGAKGHIYENRAGDIVVQTLIGGSGGGVQSNYSQDETELVKEWIDRTASRTAVEGSRKTAGAPNDLPGDVLAEAISLFGNQAELDDWWDEKVETGWPEDEVRAILMRELGYRSDGSHPDNEGPGESKYQVGDRVQINGDPVSGTVLSINPSTNDVDIQWDDGERTEEKPAALISASRKTADDYVKGDALNFINHLQNGGYRMPKDAGYPGEGGQMDDELYDYTGGDQNRISEITRFLQENWDFYAYGASRTAGAGNWSQTYDGSNEWVLNGNPQISIFEEEDGYYLFNNISLIEVTDTFEQAMELAESRYEGSRTAGAGDWEQAHDGSNEWVLNGNPEISIFEEEDGYYLFNNVSLVKVFDTLEEATAFGDSKFHGSLREAGNLGEVLEDHDVLSFFWDTFEEKGLDTTPSGAEQWEWLKSNLSKEEIEEGIDFILGVGGFISQEQADALRSDLRTGSRKVALDWSSVQEKVEQSGWDPMYADYIAWALDNGKNVEDTYSFVDYSDLLGLDAEDEQLLKKFIQNTAPRLYGSRKEADLNLSGVSDYDLIEMHGRLEKDLQNGSPDESRIIRDMNHIQDEAERRGLDLFDPNFSRKQAAKCPKCDGMGRETYEKENGSLSTQTCKACGGTGTTKESRRKEALDIDGKWEEELPGIGYASCTPKAGGGFELYMWSDTMQSEALDVVGTSEEARRVWQEWRRSDIGPSNYEYTDDNYFLGHVKHAGGTDFATFAQGSSAQEAFNNARAEAKQMYGDDGYTGSIAEKDSFEMASRTPMTEEEAKEFIWGGNGFGKFDDKWGPAGCIELDTGGFVFFGIAST